MTIAERIIEVVDVTEKGNMSRFARALDVTPAYISKLKNFPDSIPSDRTINDICKEYGVNRDWLLTGEGEMFSPLSKEQEIGIIAGDLFSDDDAFKLAIVKEIARLNPQELIVLKRIVEAGYDALNEEKPEE